MQMNQIRHRVGVAGALLSFFFNSIGTAAAGTHTWTGGGPSQNWSSVANWSGGIPTANEAPPVVLIFPANFSGPFTNNIANLTVDEIRLLGSGQTLRGANGVSLTLRGGHTLTNFYSASFNSLDATLPLELEGTNRIVAPVLFTFLNQISGSGGLEINGTVILDGDTANTFTGATIVKSGTLTLSKEVVPVSEPLGLVSVPGPLIIEGGRVTHSSDHGIGNASTVTIHPGATLDLNGYDDTIGALNLLGGTVETDAGMLTLGGNVTATGNASITGNLSLGGSIRHFDVAANRTLTVSALISGGGSSGLTKQGSGELRLSGANTYPGPTVVEAGTLGVFHATALGATGANSILHGTSLAAGATLLLNSAAVGTERLYVRGDGYLGAGALFNQLGASSWAGDIELMEDVALNVMPGASLNLSGKITGTGDLTKWGSGTLKLSGETHNDFEGQTRIEGGTLQLAKKHLYRAIPHSLRIGALDGPPVTVAALSNNQFAASQTGITIQPGCTFNLNQSTQHISNLNGSGEVQIPGTLQLAYGSYGGVISGNGTLLVANAWTGGLRITGTNNTFTGQTYVDFAHLFVDGIWPGAVHAFSSGGVGGSGVVGNVDISVGRLTPGVGHYGTAHLRTGHLALTNNSTFRFETRDVPDGIEYDRVEVSGTVKLDDVNFQPILGSAGRSNIAYILILNDGNDPVQGTFNGLPEGAPLTLDGGQFDITYQGGTGNDVVLRQLTPTTNSFPVSLTIQPKNANWVTLRWPAYASDYKLEYCTNLATGLWWPAGPLLGENDGTNVVVSEMMINRPISFFRLVHP
jgi:fibronectin-binding autotransporter adhesin